MEQAMTEEPTTEQQAKFYMTDSIGLIGYEGLLEEIVGEARHVPRGPGIETVEDAIDNMAIAFSEGVATMMQNRREIGHGPVSAFRSTIDSEWPEWVVVGIAEREYETFGGRANDPEYMTEEEEEYLTFLEDEYSVPR